MNDTICRIFAIAGIAGTILCAVGDYLLYRCNGTDSIRIGTDKKIESNWDKADIRDFLRSGILACISIPMYYLGIVAFSWCLYMHHNVLGIAYYVVLTLGAMGGVAFHLNACYMPVIYKTITQRGGSIELVEAVYAIMRKTCKLSAALTYGILVFINSIWVWIIILSGMLNVPKWLCILTPLTFLAIGVILAKINRTFKTFPLALTNTLGLGGMAVIALFCVGVN
jgi:hypothetical protein